MRIRCVLSILLMAASFSVSAQKEAPPVLGEEAQRLLLRMYDYDPEIPLEARVVERTENDSHVRFKIVFRSTRGFLVLGHLQLPATGTACC